MCPECGRLQSTGFKLLRRDKMGVGGLLAFLRERAGLTMQQVATRLDVNSSYVSMVETGDTGVSARQAARIVDAILARTLRD